MKKICTDLKKYVTKIIKSKKRKYFQWQIRRMSHTSIRLRSGKYAEKNLIIIMMHKFTARSEIIVIIQGNIARLLMVLVI